LRVTLEELLDAASSRIAALEAEAQRTHSEHETAAASLQEKISDARSLLDEARADAERARAEQAADAVTHEREKDALNDRLTDARTLLDQSKTMGEAAQREWADKLAEQEGVVTGLQAKLDDTRKLLDGAKAQADRAEKARAAQLTEQGACARRVGHPLADGVRVVWTCPHSRPPFCFFLVPEFAMQRPRRETAPRPQRTRSAAPPTRRTR
jgi:hypothetical protein